MTAETAPVRFADEFLEACLEEFRYQRRLADRAIAQLDCEEMHRVPHADGNSVVVLMKHMAGNMISRWTDFLTTDGEKPWRKRDGMFAQLHRCARGIADGSLRDAVLQAIDALAADKPVPRTLLSRLEAAGQADLFVLLDDATQPSA